MSNFVANYNNSATNELIFLMLPQQCSSKEEIRQQIDLIDKEIITLFAKRFSYVAEIVKFKNDVESVVALDRKEQVIKQRGEWAEQQNLDRKTFEKMFELLINNNIERELRILAGIQK